MTICNIVVLEWTSIAGGPAIMKIVFCTGFIYKREDGGERFLVGYKAMNTRHNPGSATQKVRQCNSFMIHAM
jgi:hypothetical protein